jgi:hypothetical protein
MGLEGIKWVSCPTSMAAGQLARVFDGRQTPRLEEGQSLLLEEGQSPLLLVSI